VDIDGTSRQAAPALGAVDGRVRAPEEALMPAAMDYGYDVQALGVLCDVCGVPQLVVVGTQVSVPALVRAAREILDLSRSASARASARDCPLCRRPDPTSTQTAACASG
jgi:hypothetical protein